MTAPKNTTDATSATPEPPSLPPGVLVARLGPGANCSSAGSAIDVLFYGSVIVGALAVALAAAYPPSPLEAKAGDDPEREPALEEGGEEESEEGGEGKGSGEPGEGQGRKGKRVGKRVGKRTGKTPRASG